MDEHAAYHALALRDGGDYGKLFKKKRCHGSWSAAWEAEAQNADAEALFGALREEGIALLLENDPGYPPPLREIPYPPHALYIKGAQPQKRVALAIVGTRKATETGRDLARSFGKSAAESGVVVISGLAFGIDAAAHTGALLGGGTTWAVLATGLDRVYPESHKKLAARILESGGSLISEYPPRSPSYPSRFLERNRIVSGLSQATLIIEAPFRSGAMATARFALDQNRDILVAPGPATHPNYGGSHALIRAGATLVTRSEEVLEALGVREEMSHSAAIEDPSQQAILSLFARSRKAMQIDEITEATTLSASETNQAVTLLVLRGLLREENGAYALW